MPLPERFPHIDRTQYNPSVRLIQPQENLPGNIEDVMREKFYADLRGRGLLEDGPGEEFASGSTA
jgi:hypothetical protein